MTDLSSIEFGIYGLIAYGTLLFIISTIVKDIPTTRSLSTTRIVFTMPGMICMGIMALSGINVNLFSTTATHMTNVINGTSGSHLTNSTTTDIISNSVALSSPVWVMVHTGFFIVLLYFVISQVMFLMTKQE